MPDIPSFATEDFKQKLTATVLAESADGQEKIVRWIYYANTNKKAGLQGLEVSSAYKRTEEWYMVFLYLLGDETYGAKPLPKSGPRAHVFAGFSTVKDYCEKNGFAKTLAKRRAAAARILIDEMYTSTNPYAGWTGQGSMDDINKEDPYWKKARCYYWLQVDGTAKEKYVEILPHGKYTQFIFDANSIDKYFQAAEHPLPKEVKKFTIGDVPK